MKHLVEEYDLVVCGGGLAGVCAAISAARLGAKTCLVQDRPVLGGNSSSEVRVTPHGSAAFHAYGRETGIISEVLIEERARNHEEILENGWTNSVWDMTLYNHAVTTPNLTLRVNTTLFAVEMNKEGRVLETPTANASLGYLHRPACVSEGHIRAVVGHIANAETEITLRGKYFIDCTGDGLVSDLAGCEWRMGTEGREEFDEPHAPEKPNRDVMGNSIHFRARDIGRPAPFTPPDWAVRYDDARFFYEQGRITKDLRGGYWWLEIGVPWDVLHDAEDIRHELTRHTLGVWDWIKNKDPKIHDLAANFALDWIGQMPGKRESRRIIGKYFLTESDVQERKEFPDEVAFGGWYIDLHTPGGLLAKTSEQLNAEGLPQTSTYARKTYVGPYGLPLRILISKDVDNLMFAGRNVSASHVALGTARVMATTALMGQAAGTACSHALRVGTFPGDFLPDDVAVVQQRLLRDGCFLPGIRNTDPLDCGRRATVTASSAALVAAVGPDDRSFHDGLLFWKDHYSPTGQEELIQRRGQWIAVAAKRIDSVSVCLTNLSDSQQAIPVWLVGVDHIWDYRSSGNSTLAHTVLKMLPGKKQWIEWPVKLDARPGTYVRLDLGANPHVCWHSASGILPGHVAAFEMGSGQMRRYGIGVTMSFRISPPQPSFSPENAISGVSRPHRETNLWRSDPAQPLPQWLELTWADRQTIGTIELTFPGHLLREYHAYQPFYKDPQCPRDYKIEIWEANSWRQLIAIRDNYQRHRRHILSQTVHSSRLRVVVTATNGDPCAAIYEVRVYPSIC